MLRPRFLVLGVLGDDVSESLSPELYRLASFSSTGEHPTMRQSTNPKYSVTVERGGLEILDRLANEWRILLEKGSESDPYSRPEWVLAQLRAYSPKANLAVLTLRHGGSLLAVMPVILENGTFGGLPARKLRMPLAVSGASSELVLASEAEQEAAVLAFWETLKSFPGWDVLELPSVYENAVLERLCEAAQNDSHRTGAWRLAPISYLRFGRADVEELPANARLRRELRQLEKKALAGRKLRLQVVETADAGVLQQFYELEASGWKGQEKSAILCDRRSQEFFNQVARDLEKFNHLSLYLLKLDGKLIAAHFGFYYQSRYYAPKAGYDEAYRDYRPGHLIVKNILRDCVNRGVYQYPMGIQEEWKLRWTKEVQKRNFRCIFNKGARAQFLFWARFKIRPGIKRLIRRSGSGTPALQENSTEGK